ncbi:MAG: DEAD/DEAH box helicase [Solirubrobacteraceae bacterium]
MPFSPRHKPRGARSAPPRPRVLADAGPPLTSPPAPRCFCKTSPADATFREHQLDAIADLVEDRARVLCVQRTGWGRSAVYFIATALLRERGAGTTLIVSPLLALMRNQIAAARRLGIRAHTVNSTNRDAWDEISGLLDADVWLGNEDTSEAVG